MPNANLPNGFKPFGRLYAMHRYTAAGTIYPGDAVKLEAGAANTTQFKARVEAGSDTGALIGVAMNYATAGQTVLVADDPNQLFVGQADDSTINENADLGDNCNILATAGDSTFKTSRMQLDASDIANTATLQVKLLGIVKRHDGKNNFGANVECIFKINNHQLAGGTGTQTV
jgi:hypothetical protein